ncbi:MAG: hypothetical protein IKR83_04680 [Bacteroidales bacterium]|nr:hypothetical protein [Bacteroidales bacterium]
MKRVIITFMLLVWAVAAFAQGSILKQTLEIAEVEINDGQLTMSVFDMPEEGQHQYFLCVGTLGIGDDYLQLQIDPLFQLFIPLGNTLEEAQAKMEEFKAIAKQPEGTEIQTVGTLALANPTMGEYETVYVASRRFLVQKIIEFSVHRNGYVRATHIAKGDFGSLLNSLKLYRKLHKKEK